MTDDELHTIYPERIDFEKQLTGHVPLFVSELLTSNETKTVFISNVNASVELSLSTLMAKNILQRDLSSLTNNMCQILLGYAFKQKLLLYDKKFFVQKYDEVLDAWIYQPLSSLAEDATRKFFWKDMMAYIATNEVSLLTVMNDSKTTNDTRGRIFEGLVIQRCMAHGVKVTLPIVGLQQKKLSIDANAFDFHGSTLQHMECALVAKGVFVPINCNFPAVDMIWKSGKCVFGVQIHVSSDKFWELCNEVSWFDQYKVYLLYLSPNDNCAIRDKKYTYCKGQPKKRLPGIKKETISIGYITIHSVQCLQNLLISKTKTF